MLQLNRGQGSLWIRCQLQRRLLGCLLAGEVSVEGDELAVFYVVLLEIRAALCKVQAEEVWGRYNGPGRASVVIQYNAGSRPVCLLWLTYFVSLLRSLSCTVRSESNTALVRTVCTVLEVRHLLR